MKTAYFAIFFILAACESFPRRHLEQVELSAPRYKQSLSMEEQTELNLKKIKNVAKAVGLKEKSCGAYTYSGHDVSPRALSFGSRLLGSYAKNAQCFEVCLENQITYMKDEKSCIGARAVAQVDPFDPNLIKVEMWTPKPTKEPELLSKKMSQLLLRLKK